MRHEKPSLSVVPPGTSDDLGIVTCRDWREHAAHQRLDPLQQCPTLPKVQGWVFGTCGRFVEPPPIQHDVECEVCYRTEEEHTLDRVMFRLCRYRDRLTVMAESCINPDSREWLTVTAGVLDEIITKTREDE